MLKAESDRGLSHTRIYSRAADDAERRGCEVCIWVCKLGMVKQIEELGTKFKSALFLRPRERDCLRDRQIHVHLAGTIYDSGWTVAERRANPIRSDQGRSCKTGCVEIVIQFRLD